MIQRDHLPVEERTKGEDRPGICRRARAIWRDSVRQEQADQASNTEQEERENGPIERTKM